MWLYSVFHLALKHTRHLKTMWTVTNATDNWNKCAFRSKGYFNATGSLCFSLFLSQMVWSTVMLAGWQSELIFQASWEWQWILLGKATVHHIWVQDIISQHLWPGSHHACGGCVHLTSLQQSESWKSNGGKWKLQMGYFLYIFFAGMSL